MKKLVLFSALSFLCSHSGYGQDVDGSSSIANLQPMHQQHLTGEWSGYYIDSSVRGRKIHFVASVQQNGSELTGAIVESNTQNNRTTYLIATIEGTVTNDTDVQFRK